MLRKLNLNWFVCILISLFATSSIQAQEESVISQILLLLNQQNSVEAFVLAQQNQPEWEGDPRFDYAFGASARAVGELDQAVFAFERVLQVQPQAVDARLGLAVSYFDLGNLAAAEKELLILQEMNLSNEAINSTTQAYLGAIQKLRSQLTDNWQSTVSAGAGIDSNPNNGIEEEFITIPVLGPVTLFEESLESESAFADVQGQLSYVKPINQHSSWQISGSVLHAEYEDDLAFDRTFVTTSAGYKTRLNEFDISGSVFYRPLWLDGEDLLDYYGLVLGTRRNIGDSYTAGLELSASQEDYSDFRGFDRDQLLANAFFEVTQTTGLHRFALRFGQEQSDDNHDFLDRDLLGLGYQWQQRLNQKWQYSVSVDYLDSEYQGVHPLFGVVREDSFFSSDLEVRYALAQRWAIKSRLSYLQNDSDIPLYEYQRVKFWLGATYEF